MLLAWAAQAVALTPLPPPCAYEGVLVRGSEIVETDQGPNQFVAYLTEDKQSQMNVYIEHCPSGKTLRAISGPNSLPGHDPRSANAMYDTIDEAIGSPEPVSLRELQRRLKAQDIRTKRFTSKTESCACQAYYPQARGTKTPYRKVTQ